MGVWLQTQHWGLPALPRSLGSQYPSRWHCSSPREVVLAPQCSCLDGLRPTKPSCKHPKPCQARNLSAIFKLSLQKTACFGLKREPTRGSLCRPHLIRSRHSTTQGFLAQSKVKPAPQQLQGAEPLPGCCTAASWLCLDPGTSGTKARQGLLFASCAANCSPSQLQNLAASLPLVPLLSCKATF